MLEEDDDKYEEYFNKLKNAYSKLTKDKKDYCYNEYLNIITQIENNEKTKVKEKRKEMIKYE